jgi:Tfp pilus assembly protein PilN
MLDINLIRWRSIQRYRHLSQLTLSLSISTSLALFIVWLLYQSSLDALNYQSDAVQQKLDTLSEIQLVPQNHKVKTSELRIYQHQYSKINNMIENHYKAHQLFEILDTLLPEQVTLIELLYRGDQLWLKGISHSNKDLSNFLIQLSQLTEFQQPKLSFSLQNNESQGQEQTNKHFELQVLFLSDYGKDIENSSAISRANPSYKSRGE